MMLGTDMHESWGSRSEKWRDDDAGSVLPALLCTCGSSVTTQSQAGSHLKLPEMPRKHPFQLEQEELNPASQPAVKKKK